MRGSYPPEPDEAGAASALRAEVREVVRGWDRALRASLLYEGTGATLERLMTVLHGQMRELWERIPELTISVEESALRWVDETVYAGEPGTENLAFTLFRDGLRELTLLPGFEDVEFGRWVELLVRVHRTRPEDDDLLTLLWEGEWRFLRYLYVDAAAEGVVLPGASSGPATRTASPREAEGTAAAAMQPDDFQGALYFLTEAELRLVAQDLRAERERDLMGDVIASLLDRLEDGDAARQETIVGIFSDLLPVLLSGGHLPRAVELLRELGPLRTGGISPGLPAVRAGVDTLFERLGEAATLQELIRVAEEVPEGEGSEALQALLALLPGSALEPLARLLGEIDTHRVRGLVLDGAKRLAAEHPGRVALLLESGDPAAASGGARLAAAFGRAEHLDPLVRLLARPWTETRLAALEALQGLRSSSAAAAIQGLLEDSDREVRVAAARALAELRYTPAGPALERILDSRRLADSDLTERIAFYEAYGSVAGAAGVGRLERTLNSRGWLGRRESGEVRACAALALGKVGVPAARQALAAAAADPDPVVRSAVTRAIRGAAA